jgi:hypothetical protein
LAAGTLFADFGVTGVVVGIEMSSWRGNESEEATAA